MERQRCQPGRSGHLGVTSQPIIRGTNAQPIIRGTNAPTANKKRHSSIGARPAIHSRRRGEVCFSLQLQWTSFHFL